MAAKAPSNNPLPLDPEDELTRPEARPGLRATVEPPPGLLSPLVPALSADPAGDSDENADAVTLIDLGRRRLVNVETLPPPTLPPSDLPDLE